MDTVRPMVIAALVVSEVGLWQWRMVIAHRGHHMGAMLLGAVGALLQITAISQVVADVHDVWSVGAYAGGVGVGVLIGMLAGDRLTPGFVGVTIITTSADTADRLWVCGWAVTAHPAQNAHGPVTVLSLAINRRQLHRLRRDVARLDPAAVCRVEDLRAAPAAPTPIPV